MHLLFPLYHLSGINELQYKKFFIIFYINPYLNIGWWSDIPLIVIIT